MKLLIQYDTRVKIPISENVFSYEFKETEVDAIRIFRDPCGISGKARERYRYTVEAEAPNDAVFVYDGDKIRANINRKKNKHFNPKKLKFNGNIATA